MSSLFEIRSLIGASASRVRSAKINLEFMRKCDPDVRDSKEYVHAVQELRVAEAEAAIIGVEFQSALASTDDIGRGELIMAAKETGFAVAA